MFIYLAFQASHSANNKYLQAPSVYLERADLTAITVEECGQYETESICRKRLKDGGLAGRKSALAQIAAMDDAIGKVVDTLVAEGFWNDTLLIFTSDNGGPATGSDSNQASGLFAAHTPT